MSNVQRRQVHVMSTSKRGRSEVSRSLSQRRNITLPSKEGLRLLSRHGIPCANGINKTKKGPKFIISIFIDRANFQPCAIASALKKDKCLHNPKFLLGCRRELTWGEEGPRIINTSADKGYTNQRRQLSATLEALISAENLIQLDDIGKLRRHCERIVDLLISLFRRREALLLDVTFLKRIDADNVLAHLLAEDAHTVFDDAAYKSSGRQKKLHEGKAKDPQIDQDEVEASKDGIVYIK